MKISAKYFSNVTYLDGDDGDVGDDGDDGDGRTRRGDGRTDDGIDNGDGQ
jgi:hypothetical protein